MLFSSFASLGRFTMSDKPAITTFRDLGSQDSARSGDSVSISIGEDDDDFIAPEDSDDQEEDEEDRNSSGMGGDTIPTILDQQQGTAQVHPAPIDSTDSGKEPEFTRQRGQERL